ncbi:MAG: hypothetical protein ACXVGN_00050 [Mycobacteriaceae bacterium]
MEPESVVWDEIADRLVVIYNQIRGCRSDIKQYDKACAKAMADLARLEAMASQYEALFTASDSTGIPA